MRPVLRGLAVAAAAALLLARAGLAWPLELPQSDGTTLELEGPADRLITLAPGLAELVFAAGAGERLLATVEYSDYPEAAAKLPRIGDAFRFDLERILALKPDLVLAWTSGNPQAALERLESLAIPVWRIEPRVPGDIPDLMEWIGIATGRPQEALKPARRLRGRVESIGQRYAGREPVRYFYQVSPQPLYTLNGEHILSQGLALCGGVNVFEAEPVIAPQVSVEAVLLADPDVFFAPTIEGHPDPLAQWRHWPRLRAVSTHSLHGLPADAISRATPRMLDSLELACTLLDQSRSANTESR
ncbi:MAG: cobalamin-binding protein [Xanthomonadales bacterium]|nr:cobalamin-binding protein [Xanthomonadales bacterium]